MMWALTLQVGFLVFAVFMGVFRLGGNSFSFVFSIAMVICACVYLVFDLLCVIIPNVMDKEAYILASLMLYMDMAQLFWHLLILFSKKD